MGASAWRRAGAARASPATMRRRMAEGHCLIVTTSQAGRIGRSGDLPQRPPPERRRTLGRAFRTMTSSMGSPQPAEGNTWWWQDTCRAPVLRPQSRGSSAPSARRHHQGSAELPPCGGRSTESSRKNGSGPGTREGATRDGGRTRGAPPGGSFDSLIVPRQVARRSPALRDAKSGQSSVSTHPLGPQSRIAHRASPQPSHPLSG